jgi:hypothetical protein
MNMKLKIATDFSRVLGARNPRETARYSGEEFRRNLLYPRLCEAMRLGEPLEVDLDGTAGMGCGFLDAAFGGLILEEKMKYADLEKYLVFKSKEDPDYLKEINHYLRRANEEAGH